MDPHLAPMVADALVLARDHLATRQPLPEVEVVGTGGGLGVDEHAVVPAHQLLQPVALEAAEVLVGGEHLAAAVELDHGLRAVNGLELALRLEAGALLGGDVLGDQDHLGQAAVQAQHRAQRGGEPQLATAVGPAAHLVGHRAAVGQPGPVLLVGGVGRVLVELHEAARLAHHLLAVIAQRLEQPVVDRDDLAPAVHLQHAGAVADGGHARRQLEGRELAVGDVGAELDHLHRLTLVVEHGVVGGLDPDAPPVLAQAQVLAAVVLATAQLQPELAVGGAGRLVGLDEHAVVLADHLVDVVAHQLQEVLVRGEHMAGQVELDHALRAADGRQLAVVLDRLVLGVGDVCCELHHLVGLAIHVEDGRVGGLQPHRAATGRAAAELAALRLAVAQLGPELLVGLAGRELRVAEQAVRLADHRLALVAQGLQEQAVGGDHRALHVELHHRLRAVDGRDDAVGLQHAPLALGHVDGVLHHLDRLTGDAQHRHVGRMQPHRMAVRVEPRELAGAVPAGAQVGPEDLVLVAGGERRRAQHAVRLADHLLAGVAQRLQVDVVGREDVAVEVELDHRLGAVDGGDAAVVLERLALDLGDIEGELDHRHHAAVVVQHRVVAGLGVHQGTVPGAAAVLRGELLAAAQPVPELVVGQRGHLVGIAEDAVVLSDDLVLAVVAEQRQEVLVGAQHRAVERELDDRLAALDGGKQAGQFGGRAPGDGVAQGDGFFFGIGGQVRLRCGGGERRPPHRRQPAQARCVGACVAPDAPAVLYEP